MEVTLHTIVLIASVAIGTVGQAPDDCVQPRPVYFAREVERIAQPQDRSRIRNRWIELADLGPLPSQLDSLLADLVSSATKRSVHSPKAPSRVTATSRIIAFVVDTNGRGVMCTVRFYRPPADSLTDMLLATRMRFRPATVAGIKVPQIYIARLR